MAGSDQFDAGGAVAGLGQSYRFTQTSFKPYACCRWAHSTLDAIREVIAGLRPGEQINDVEVRSFGDLVHCLSWAKPEDLVDAQFSLPFLVALELADRSCRRGFDETAITDPDVLRRAQDVRLVHDPSADEAFYAGHLPTRVIATTDQGAGSSPSKKTPGAARPPVRPAGRLGEVPLPDRARPRPRTRRHPGPHPARPARRPGRSRPRRAHDQVTRAATIPVCSNIFYN